MSFLFKNLRLLDPNWKEARGGYEVLVEGDTIKEVSNKPIKAAKATVVNCGKRTLMPGLIDCHVHTHHSEVYINRMEAVPLTLMMASSAGRLKRMLDRGFTTVRDAGGADWGTKTAVESGLIPGPRLFISCRSIGPTGGHNDRNRRAPRAARWAKGGARPDAPGRRSGEADGLGRRRVALRSAGIAAVHRGGDHRRRRGGARLRPLRAD